MDRLLRLNELWPYLIAFRAVAETEHLPTAAERLHVTPSALSRSIGQLERRLAQPLFDRRGRRLELNSSGREFLDTVRDVMRYLDDGVERLTDPELSGPLRVVSVSQLATTLLIDALPAFLVQHPRVAPSLGSSAKTPLSDLLLGGEIDVAFMENPIRRPGLTLTKLGSYRNAVYCRMGHPLARRKRVDPALLAKHAFVAPPALSGAPLDDWPAELTRTVALRVDQMQVAMACCAGSDLLGAFPERVVRGHGYGARLRALPWNGLPSATVYALARKQLSPDDAAAELIATVQRSLDE